MTGKWEVILRMGGYFHSIFPLKLPLKTGQESLKNDLFLLPYQRRLSFSTSPEEELSRARAELADVSEVKEKRRSVLKGFFKGLD